MAQKATIGAFVRVPIDENYHTYGRIIRDHVYAFYDLKTNLEISDLDVIEKSQVLFKLMIHRSAIAKGNWKIIGTKELSDDLKVPVPFFIQEIGKPETCWIDINGSRTKVSPSECVGLERFSIWEHDHVEQMLSDYYNGVPNKDSIALRVNGSIWKRKI